MAEKTFTCNFWTLIQQASLPEKFKTKAVWGTARTLVCKTLMKQGGIMDQWLRIGALSDMPVEGRAKGFVVGGGTTVCVARIGGELAALQDECPHHGAPLSEGAIENGRVVCSWHGWSFDPKTGTELRNPLGGARVFPLRVDGEDVLCEI